MDTGEIKDVIQTYFDAGYQSDGALMGETLHDAAHIIGIAVDDGAFINWEKNQFLEIVGSNPPGASENGYPYLGEIDSIEFTSENTAVARVRVRVVNTIFTDILSFIRLEGTWKIINKVFAGVPAV